jgi:hypothetical protein
MRQVPLSLKLWSLLAFIVSWFIPPSLALFLGAVPFLRKPQTQA